MNQVLLVGRLVRDVDLRTTTSGADVARFTLAIPRNYKNKNGEYLTDFINCITWRNLARNMAEYCKKGDLVGIKGRIQNVSYTDRDGNNIYKTEIIADNVTFLANSNKKEEPTQKNEVETESVKQEDPFASFGEEIVINDDDLPF